MQIGAAAAASGVSRKMIRHYESIGLLSPAPRSAAGYRHYTNADLHTLRFIKTARALGFSLEEITQLLSLWQDKKRPSGEVKKLVEAHMGDLEGKIAELTAMRAALRELAQLCQGGERPDCPILAGLAHETAAP